MEDHILWSNDSIVLELEVPVDAPVRVRRLAPADGASASPTRARIQPLVEVIVLGDGHAMTNTRFVDSGVGNRLRYVSHTMSQAPSGQTLKVVQADSHTGLEVTSTFTARTGVPALRTWTEVTQRGESEIVLQLVSSFASGAWLGGGENIADLDLGRARSEWCAESRWNWIPLRGPDGLPKVNVAVNCLDSRGALITTSRSTWSSGEYLPTGVLVNRATGSAWAWQIEHNGPWRWEVDSRREDENAVALVLTGPNDLDHQWMVELAQGETFTSIPVSIAAATRGIDGALSALTMQRRAIRLHRTVDQSVPVIFNDYMNALMGDPTTKKLLPLIDAAAKAGAEYFCIDAGWYDDGGDWWPSVGEWEPSTTRFPDGGLMRVMDHIRSHDMKPGLWLEPEVIGVRSPVADRLPDGAFLQRAGRRIVEHDRYLLDLRHPAAVKHLDYVIDALVDQFAVRYFKLDYNVTPGAGTDFDTFSVGDGLLRASRAHLSWLDQLLERHPEVIFENCASGALRMDYALLSRLDLQSTSDQRDFQLYATIAAAAPASVLPEQAGNWAYPLPDMSLEDIAFTMVNGLAGRLYLSGGLDHLSVEQSTVVHEAVAAFKDMRAETCRSLPSWPLGLPGWFDEQIALALTVGPVVYLVLWHRGPAATRFELDLLDLVDSDPIISQYYPREMSGWAGPVWEKRTGRFSVDVDGAGPSARVFRLTQHGQHG